jgi:hypothetical protein
MSVDQTLWQYFPKSISCPKNLLEIVKVFENSSAKIISRKNIGQVSNDVLAHVRGGLESLGFLVESDKTLEGKIRIPVLYGPNGKPDKSFDADAYHPDQKIVLEVEAGRAVTNYQFLKDLFQACVMQDVDYAVIAVRQDYRGSDDYGKVISFIETLYASTKLQLPLKGLLIVGY